MFAPLISFNQSTQVPITVQSLERHTLMVPAQQAKPFFIVVAGGWVRFAKKTDDLLLLAAVDEFAQS